MTQPGPGQVNVSPISRDAGNLMVEQLRVQSRIVRAARNSTTNPVIQDLAAGWAQLADTAADHLAAMLAAAPPEDAR